MHDSNSRERVTDSIKKGRLVSYLEYRENNKETNMKFDEFQNFYLNFIENRHKEHRFQ